MNSLACIAVLAAGCGSVLIEKKLPVQTIPGNPLLHHLGRVIDDVAGLPPIESDLAPDIESSDAARADDIELERVELTIVPGDLTFPGDACWSFVKTIELAVSADLAPALPTTKIAAVRDPACIENLIIDEVPDVDLRPYATEGMRIHFAARGVPPPWPVAFEPTLVIRAYY